MSIFAKLFKKKTTEEESARVGGMEDFMHFENPDPKQQVRRGRAFAMQKDADRHLWHQRILL